MHAESKAKTTSCGSSLAPSLAFCFFRARQYVIVVFHMLLFFRPFSLFGEGEAVSFLLQTYADTIASFAMRFSCCVNEKTFKNTCIAFQSLARARVSQTRENLSFSLRIYCFVFEIDVLSATIEMEEFSCCDNCCCCCCYRSYRSSCRCCYSDLG